MHTRAQKPDLRILIAEDNVSTRKGLKRLLELESDMEVVAETGNGREAVVLARQHQPCSIVMDIGMPELSGIEATRQILTSLPNTKVLIISCCADDFTIEEALSSGAHGYISKAGSLLEVPAALRVLRGGETYFGTVPPV
ncbi:MAG: response regulator transcription factor [Opitutus sp.]